MKKLFAAAVAAPVGMDSDARTVAPPGALNQGPFDAVAWKYGDARMASSGRDE